MATDDPKDHAAANTREVSPSGRLSRRHRVAKILKCLAVIVAFLGGYIGWFSTAKPLPNVDYVAMLNRATQPEGVADTDNAWPHYEKAIQLLSSHPAGHIWGFHMYPDPNETARAAITNWVRDNDPAWQELVLATRSPQCWKPYATRGPGERDILDSDIPMLRIDTKHLASLRELLLLGVWRIRTETQQGQIQPALGDCCVVIRMGRQWIENKPLLDALVGLAAIKTGHSELVRLLANAPAGAIDWQDAGREIETACPSGVPPIKLDFERLEFLDIVQHTFTRGGLGGGHLAPQALWPFVQVCSIVKTLSPLPTKSTWRQRTLYMGMSLVHARRNATVRRYDVLLDRLKEVMSMNPYHFRASGPPDEGRPHIFNNEILFKSFRDETRFFMATVSIPTDRLSQVWWESAAWHDATKSLLAIHRWRDERREYPQTLQQLLDGGYIASLPPDPYGDGCLVYRRTGDNFTLYSRGCNFQDDGGKSLVDPDHSWRMWGTEQEGDAVFWPVSPQMHAATGDSIPLRPPSLR